jgi:UMF1 family MFS transporter
MTLVQLYSLYTYSTSVLVQALLIISFSQLANLPSYRKTLLVAFTYIGSSASLFFPLINIPSLLSLLAMLSIAFFGVASVCFNSYLPSLGKDGDAVRAAKRAWEEEKERVEHAGGDQGGGSGGVDERPGLMLPGVEFASSPGEGDLLAPLLDDLTLTHQVQSTTIDNLYRTYTASVSLYTSRISLLSIAIAYSGGAFLLLPSFVLVSALDESLLSLRLVVGLSGALWGLLAVPAVIWLGGWGSKGGRRQAEKMGSMRNVRESWVGLGRMLRPTEIRKLRNTFVYLLCWMFISDGSSP